MLCISGFSGTGKDEIASRLVSEYSAIQTGLADPAKRHMADLYGFTEQQLFGPSHFRNKGDLRYPKEAFYSCDLKPSIFSHDHPPDNLSGALVPGIKYWQYTDTGIGQFPCTKSKLSSDEFINLVHEGDPLFWLSPRETLQRYCELMNDMYLRTWSRKGVSIHKKLAFRSDGSYAYDYTRMDGLIPNQHRKLQDPLITCFADFRHIHEIKEANDAETQDLIPVLIRVKRPSVPYPPYNHRSEVEQTKIKDEAFDYLVNNDDSLDSLYDKVDRIVEELKDPEWKKLRDVKRIMIE